MVKSTLFLILVLLCFACSDTNIDSVIVTDMDEDSTNHETQPERHIIHEYIFGNRFEIEGDFDGDGQKEKLTEHYYDSSTKEEVSKYIVGMEDADRTRLICPLSFMLCDNAKIDTLFIDSGLQISGVLFIKNEGDLNDDGNDEISYVTHYADWSSMNKWYITTFKNGKWTELLSFPMSEWQLEQLPEGNKSLVKKTGEKSIQITYRNEESEMTTKTVRLK